MIAQQMRVDTISNNLSNVNTTGFKKSRVDFQELLYVSLRAPGVTTQTGYQVPTGLEVGHGVRPGGTLKLFGQGPLQQTSNPLDMAIEGDGFFAVQLPDDSIAYTRDGSFKLDGEGRLVTTTGMRLIWGADAIPDDAVQVFIASDGTVTALTGDGDEPEELGQITTWRFMNPAGLESIGSNMWKETVASGEAEEGTPGEAAFGTILQRFLEGSNVQVVEEMVDLIVAQRAYEICSRAIQSSDEMLSIANGLRR